MTYPSQLSVPPYVFDKLRDVMRWLTDRPPIVEVQEDQHQWFTSLFVEACACAPEYKDIKAPLFSLEYDKETDEIALVLFEKNEEQTEIARIPMVADENVPLFPGKEKVIHRPPLGDFTDDDTPPQQH